jgi:hypothetical protein
MEQRDTYRVFKDSNFLYLNVHPLMQGNPKNPPTALLVRLKYPQYIL